MQTEVEAFSSRLRAATSRDHREAESEGFITELMKGERTAADYLLLLTQYRPLYAALEAATARWRHDGRVAALFDPALDRLGAIDADLARLREEEGVEALPDVTPATLAYVARVEDAGREREPWRLVAHHYLRYLGDLSGGQAIGALVARHYGIPAEALSMWSFASVPKPKVYKDGYRARLDRIEDPVARRTVIDEAAAGFGLNRRVFAELGRVAPRPLTLSA